MSSRHVIHIIGPVNTKMEFNIVTFFVKLLFLLAWCPLVRQGRSTGVFNNRLDIFQRARCVTVPPT